MTQIGEGSRIVNDRMLRKARALASWHEPTTQEILFARRLHRDGACLQEIHDALHAAFGWTCSRMATRNRFKKLGLELSIKSRAHRGEKTGLPNSERGVNQRSYRPKSVRAA
jgi:hypothetical protein